MYLSITQRTEYTCIMHCRLYAWRIYIYYRVLLLLLLEEHEKNRVQYKNTCWEWVRSPYSINFYSFTVRDSAYVCARVLYESMDESVWVWALFFSHNSNLKLEFYVRALSTLHPIECRILSERDEQKKIAELVRRKKNIVSFISNMYFISIVLCIFTVLIFIFLAAFWSVSRSPHSFSPENSWFQIQFLSGAFMVFFIKDFFVRSFVRLAAGASAGCIAAPVLLLHYPCNYNFFFPLDKNI